MICVFVLWEVKDEIPCSSWIYHKGSKVKVGFTVFLASSTSKVAGFFFSLKNTALNTENFIL